MTRARSREFIFIGFLTSLAEHGAVISASFLTEIELPA
jgi:hypothetical protein